MERNTRQRSARLPHRERGPRLTAREREVARLLVEGRTDREIAADLAISRKTASNHVSRILAKLDARTRTAAATALLRGGG